MSSQIGLLAGIVFLLFSPSTLILEPFSCSLHFAFLHAAFGFEW
jgi:hypothetical protein